MLKTTQKLITWYLLVLPKFMLLKVHHHGYIIKSKSSMLPPLKKKYANADLQNLNK